MTLEHCYLLQLPVAIIIVVVAAVDVVVAAVVAQRQQHDSSHVCQQSPQVAKEPELEAEAKRTRTQLN